MTERERIKGHNDSKDTWLLKFFILIPKTIEGEKTKQFGRNKKENKKKKMKKIREEEIREEEIREEEMMI